MARHNLPFDKVPRVVYTYFTQEGEKRAIIINRDLDDLPYWFSAEQAMLEPRTPLAVRTLLFNNMVATNKRESFRQYATHVHLHTTQTGLTFMEIRLTVEGAKFIMADLRGMQAAQKKILYDCLHVAADKVFDAFTPRLRDALTFLGLKP